MLFRSTRPRIGEVYYKAKPAQKGRIQSTLHIGGKNCQAAEGLHALQQIIDLDVSIAIVAVLHLAALAKERVCLIKEQNRPSILCGVKELFQVLLRLPDVLANHLREIDAIEVHLQLIGDYLGRHGLPRAALASKQYADAKAPIHPPAKSPLIIDLSAVSDLGGDLMEQLALVLCQDDVTPGGLGIEAVGLKHRVGSRIDQTLLPEPLMQALITVLLGKRIVGYLPNQRQVKVKLSRQQIRAIARLSLLSYNPSFLLFSGRGL